MAKLVNLSVKLLPCPFCGHAAECYWKKIDAGFRHWIACTGCTIKTGLYRDAPVDMWNNRCSEQVI